MECQSDRSSMTLWVIFVDWTVHFNCSSQWQWELHGCFLLSLDWDLPCRCSDQHLWGIWQKDDQQQESLDNLNLHPHDPMFGWRNDVRHSWRCSRRCWINDYARESQNTHESSGRRFFCYGVWDFYQCFCRCIQLCFTGTIDE
jgi:hypothetical protein